MFEFGNFYELIHNLLDDLLHLNKHILLNLHFEGSVLVNEHFHLSLNLSNDIPNHLFFNYFLNNLWNLDYFLDNSWNNDNFLNKLLDFDDLWHFNHLLNHLINLYPHLFDPVDDSGHFHNFLLHVLEWFGHFDEMIDNLFDFHNLGFFDDQGVSQVDLFDNCVLYPLNYWLLNKLSHCHKSFMNNGHLHNFFNFPRHFSDHLYNLGDHFLDNLNLLLNHYLLPDHLDFLHSGLGVYNLHYLLNKLRHFHNSLDCLDNGHWLLYNSFDDFVLDFDMIEHLSGIPVLDNRDQFLYYFLNFDYFRHFDDLLNDFLHNDRDLNNFLYYFLNGHHLLLHDFHLLVLFLNVIHYSLYLHYFLHLHDLLFEFFNLHDFRYFFFHFDELLHNCWHFDYPFNDVFKGHYFLNCAIVDYRLLQRYVYYSINLFDFLDFDNLFNDSVNSHDLWDLHKLLHDFLDNFLHLHDFRHHSEYLENIINIDNTHNLLSNHTHYSLIHFRH